MGAWCWGRQPRGPQVAEIGPTRLRTDASGRNSAMLRREDDELRDHPQGGVIGDVTMEQPAPEGAARAGPVHARPVVQAHSEDQTVFARNVEGVDQFAVVEAKNWFAGGVQHADRLEAIWGINW